MRNFPLLAGLLSFLLGGSVVFAAAQKMPYHRNDTFLFCLNPIVEPLAIQSERTPVEVGIPALNEFFQDNGIVRIEPWIRHATDKDHDGNIYSNRIYRVYLAPARQGELETIKTKLESLALVLSAEFENVNRVDYTPNDTRYYQQCSLPAVKADLAWDYFINNGQTPGSRQVLLASVDTGVYYTHSDLQDNIWINQAEVPSSIFSAVDGNSDGLVTSPEVVSYLTSNNLDLNSDGVINLQDVVQTGSPFLDNADDDSNGFTDDIIGWDLSGWSGADDNDPMSKSGVGSGSTWAHGTHVSGILAATSDNNNGIASTAFNASLIPVKCSREEQTGEPFVNDGYAGLIYAAKAGYYAGTFTIINLSWGGGGFSSYEQSQINIAHDTYGAVIVAAAGNGLDTPPYGEEYAVHYPSSYDNVISVAAIGCNGVWGHWATYHETVDLSAPGEGVLSTIIGTGYTYWDGSSMASPNAASCIGLLKAFYPSWTNTELETRILETADPFIYDLNTEDYLQGRLGTGMVDIYNAIGAGYLPLLNYYSHAFVWVIDDGDNVLNPGEAVEMRILLQNELGRALAQNVVGTLRSNTLGIVVTDSVAEYPDINPGAIGVNITDTFAFNVSNGIPLGEISFTLHIDATGEAGAEYTVDIPITDQVTLNQNGWPVTDAAQVESSPVVVDLDGDGNNEIIYGDYDGQLHILDRYAAETAGFPFATGDDIWGSPAVADLDRDGTLEIIIGSKAKHLYILNGNGSIQTDYNANQYLMGTPAVGNLDDDADLEIVFGGYGSPGRLFAINPDGSDVAGFPIEVGEKIQRGVALGDFNGNGKDDIVFGTDSDHLWLILDDGTTATGFPFTAGGDFRAAPSIGTIGGAPVIFAGSRDDHLYAINGDGTERFSVATGGDVGTSPALYPVGDSLQIFFGADDGLIYGVDANGNSLNGWPIDLGSPAGSSPALADLDADGEPEIVANSANGVIGIYHLDGSPYNNFPFQFGYSMKGLPTIADTDNDGDLEVLIGYSSGMINLDIKTPGEAGQYWATHQGNYRRNGNVNSAWMDIDPVSETIPDEISLSPAYPNPFNPGTTIEFSVADFSNVNLSVFNLLGQNVRTLAKARYSPGHYTIRWNAGPGLSAGIYIIRMTVNSAEGTRVLRRKVLFLK
ncbi:MAG: S8 family serine peptidase [Fidelibacterota bacterium]